MLQYASSLALTPPQGALPPRRELLRRRRLAEREAKLDRQVEWQNETRALDQLVRTGTILMRQNQAIWKATLEATWEEGNMSCNTEHGIHSNSWSEGWQNEWLDKCVQIGRHNGGDTAGNTSL